MLNKVLFRQSVKNHQIEMVCRNNLSHTKVNSNAVAISFLVVDTLNTDVNARHPVSDFFGSCRLKPT